MTKYTKLVGLLVLLYAAPQACAFQLKALVGNWRGRFVAKEEGEVTREYHFKMSGQMLTDGSVVLVERFESAHESFTARHRFSKSGKYAVSGGNNNTTFTGSWKMDGPEILITGKYTNPGGTDKFTGKLVFVDKDHFKYGLKQHVGVNNYNVKRL